MSSPQQATPTKEAVCLISDVGTNEACQELDTSDNLIANMQQEVVSDEENSYSRPPTSSKFMLS